MESLMILTLIAFHMRKLINAFLSSSSEKVKNRHRASVSAGDMFALLVHAHPLATRA